MRRKPTRINLEDVEDNRGVREVLSDLMHDLGGPKVLARVRDFAAQHPRRELIEHLLAKAWDPRLALRELMEELGGPGTNVRKVRRWAQKHGEQKLIVGLLDEIEAPRREAFEALVLETIARRAYPSADQLEVTRTIRRLREQRPGLSETAIAIQAYNERTSGFVLDGDQARWRAALLRRLGWKMTQGARWTPAGSP